MEIKWFGPGQLDPVWAARLRALLTEVSEEFVPPLLGRTGTTQQFHGAPSGNSEIQNAQISEAVPPSPSAEIPYLSQLLRQSTLIAADGPELAGFLSYKYRYRHPQVDAEHDYSYISTIAVGPKFRRRGVALKLYQKLFTLPVVQRQPRLLLRTWSENSGHIALLHQLGFAEVARLADDRAPGTDTLYFAKLISIE